MLAEHDRLPARLAAAEIGGRRDPAFHAAVDARFEAIADAEPERVRRIDASGDPGAVTARLVDALTDLIA